MVRAGRYPAASAPGLLALIAWTGYVLLAAFFYAPDYPASALTLGACGILTVFAVAANFAYWRSVVVLASIVYLAFYAVRVLRMVALTSGFEVSALLSALAFYYGSSWRVTAGLLQERGAAGALAHGYIEYAMPLLSVELILLVWMSRKR
jgi:hypothetical protein